MKRTNLAFYEPRTEHGSSLSRCMHALLACETGDSDSGYPFFLKAAEIDYTDDGKHFADLLYIGGTHPAARLGVRELLGPAARRGLFHRGDERGREDHAEA